MFDLLLNLRQGTLPERGRSRPTGLRKNFVPCRRTSRSSHTAEVRTVYLLTRRFDCYVVGVARRGDSLTGSRSGVTHACRSKPLSCPDPPCSGQVDDPDTRGINERPSRPCPSRHPAWSRRSRSLACAAGTERTTSAVTACVLGRVTAGSPAFLELLCVSSSERRPRTPVPSDLRNALPATGVRRSTKESCVHQINQ